MNNVLDNLFYKEKLGIGNKATFIKNIEGKDIQEYVKNQEVSQTNTKVNKSYQYKITAPPRTFQIDIFLVEEIRNIYSYVIICRYIKP